MELAYHDKVFAALAKMPAGTVHSPALPLVIAKTVKPENREAFAQAVRMAIDLEFLGPEFWFDFNNEYTEVRKWRK